MRRRVAERLRYSKGTKILISGVSGWLLQWKGGGLVELWSTRSMNCVSCCSHKYLGWLARAEKKGCVLLSSLPDFRDQGSQSSTFTPKKKKSNSLQGISSGGT